MAAIAPQAQAPRPVAPPAAIKPKLVVLISVDQMRGDYIDRFRHQWSKGLHRLVTDGAWFRQADYPVLHHRDLRGSCQHRAPAPCPPCTAWCSNPWAVQNNSRIVSCTDDESQKLISYGDPGRAASAHSAANLMSPTLADEMRSQSWPAPRVVGISLKARSAINLSGHRPDAVIWLDERDGGWVTSTAFAKAHGAVLCRLHREAPDVRAVGPDVGPLACRRSAISSSTRREFRRRTPHVTTEFPHITKGRGEEVGGAITDAWEASPYSDAYLNGLAFSAIDAMKLGRGAGTDFLGISFSALDLTGHSTTARARTKCRTC